MKTKILAVLLVMLSTVAFAQKKEVKKARSAVKEGSYAEALAFLQTAQPNFSELNDEYQVEFHYLMGKALFGNGNLSDLNRIQNAAMSYQKAIELGNSNGETDLVDDAESGLFDIRSSIVNNAVEDQNAEKFVLAANKLESAYRIFPADTSFLYYAASNALNGADYPLALKYYEELDQVGFTGITTNYYATNPLTEVEETFTTMDERDNAIRIAKYINPRQEEVASLKGEIIKNIALINIQNGDPDKAIAAIQRAKQQFPDDLVLLESEASIYLQLGETAKYEAAVKELLVRDPNNYQLYYNLGVTSHQAGNITLAQEMYKKALSIDPSYYSANVNLANIILERDPALLKEMNTLGTSNADYDRYDEIDLIRKANFNEAIPYLESALRARPENVDIVRSLMSLYSQVGNTAKKAEMKTKLEMLGGR